MVTHPKGDGDDGVVYPAYSFDPRPDRTASAAPDPGTALRGKGQPTPPRVSAREGRCPRPFGGGPGDPVGLPVGGGRRPASVLRHRGPREMARGPQRGDRRGERPAPRAPDPEGRGRVAGNGHGRAHGTGPPT